MAGKMKILVEKEFEPDARWVDVEDLTQVIASEVFTYGIGRDVKVSVHKCGGQRVKIVKRR